MLSPLAVMATVSVLFTNWPLVKVSANAALEPLMFTALPPDVTVAVDRPLMPRAWPSRVKEMPRKAVPPDGA